MGGIGENLSRLFFCGDGVVSQVPDFCLHFFTASRQRIGQCRAARIRGRTFKNYFTQRG
jgi:hypothetical protein